MFVALRALQSLSIGAEMCIFASEVTIILQNRPPTLNSDPN